MFSASIKFTGIDAITGPVKRMQANVETFASAASGSFGKVGGFASTLGNRVDSLAGKMISFKTALMGGAVYMASKSLYHMAAASAEANFQQLKFAQRTGMNIQSVKELNYALKGQGVTMDEGMKWIERFSSQMGKLKLNSGNLYSFLATNDRKLLDQLKNSKTIDQSFNMIADSVKRIHDPMKRAAFVTAAFGQKARTITGLLMQGSDGIRKAREEYKNLMGTTTISAEAIDRFRKSQMQLSTAFSSVKMAIGMSAIPAITAVMDKARDWFMANGKLLKNEMIGWIKLFANAILIVVRNLNIIIPVILGFVTVLTVLKVVSVAIRVVTLAMAAAQFIAAGAMAFTYIATGTLTEALLTNATALKMVTAWEWMVTAAQWAWNTALAAFDALNPFAWVIVAIAAVVAGIVLLISYWDKIKAKMDEVNNSALGSILQIVNPIWTIISLIQYMQDRWDGIKRAFSEGGFIKGIEAVGRAILSFILRPFEMILKFIAKVTGAQWANNLSKSIEQFRGGLDVGLTTKKGETSKKEAEKPVNKDVSILTQKQIRETNSTQNVQINIDDDTGRARLGGNTNPIPVFINNTKTLKFGFPNQ